MTRTHIDDDELALVSFDDIDRDLCHDEPRWMRSLSVPALVRDTTLPWYVARFAALKPYPKVIMQTPMPAKKPRKQRVKRVHVDPKTVFFRRAIPAWLRMGVPRDIVAYWLHRDAPHIAVALIEEFELA